MPGVDVLIWPAVAAICSIVIGLAALLTLRPALMRMVDRISKAGKDGVSFSERSQERGEIQAPLSFVDLMKHPISATALEREQIIKEQLQTFDLKSDDEKISVLVRSLATTRIEMEFNSISNIIFGSQVTLLVQLSSTTRSIPVTNAEEIYRQALNAFPSMYENRTFNDWLDYLLAHNLVIKKDEKLDITQIGTDFLKHLVDARLAYERMG